MICVWCSRCRFAGCMLYHPYLSYTWYVCCSRCGFAGCMLYHSYLSYTWYVCVVPGVVIHQYGSVCHGCYLITVIPPWHHFSILQKNTQPSSKQCNTLLINKQYMAPLGKTKTDFIPLVHPGNYVSKKRGKDLEQFLEQVCASVNSPISKQPWPAPCYFKHRSVMATGKIIITVTGFHNCLAYKADHMKFAITLPFSLYTQFMNLSCSYNCLLFQPNAIQSTKVLFFISW